MNKLWEEYILLCTLEAGFVQGQIEVLGPSSGGSFADEAKLTDEQKREIFQNHRWVAQYTGDRWGPHAYGATPLRAVLALKAKEAGK